MKVVAGVVVVVVVDGGYHAGWRKLVSGQPGRSVELLKQGQFGERKRWKHRRRSNR